MKAERELNDKELMLLYEAGIPARALAEMIGVTRGSICGRIYRLRNGKKK